MSGKSATIAVFDLDGTITSKDTFLEFIKYAVGNRRYYLGLAFLSPYIMAFYLKLLPNYRLKEKFFGHFFKGKKEKGLKRIGEDYSEIEIPKIVRKGAQRVLQWHKSQGHTILVLSASADIWLSKWCHIHGYELICTQFEVKDGHYTGRINGRNCFGEEKKIRLKSFMNSHSFDYSYGYGDSKADRYFLELVNAHYLMPLDDKNINLYWSPNKKTGKGTDCLS